MNINFLRYTVFLVFLLLIVSVQYSFAWFDKTHLAVAKVAEYDRWFNAAAPDIARIKAGKIEDYNHYYNNNRNITITPEIVLSQTDRYNNPRDKDGHLYGAIIGSLRAYVKISKSGGFADSHFAFFVHYVADLSQPFHNIPYDNFNKSRHLLNDGIVDREVLDNLPRISRHMYKVDLQKGNLEYAVAHEIARIANQARQLGNKLKKEDRNMTKDEVYIQLGHSASLISAVVKKLEK